ncbi:MAG: penicillin acylase family protein [Alphaproteobacteria bacterium]|nr:penicillin acylase family protein [Alphaproteobacteria bacterium]MCW5742324.1 penicillin acylase family protein [Alphaproteobacteria bacterium]
MRAARQVLLGVLALVLPGCAALSPQRTTSEDRLSGFPTTELPLAEPVTIRWNAHQVPFIDAATDRDLAFALGMVHLHLREGQLEVLRRISQGRLSESAGPFTVDIDHSLRILGLGRAVDAVIARMPADTQDFAQAFVDGMNHYQSRRRHKPPEFGLMGIAAEPWTLRDILTIGRLAGADVNWLVYFAMLKERGKPGFAEIWRRTLAAGADGATSFAATPQETVLSDILAGRSRSGSNSVAVSARNSATGGALIASDPHLGLSLPNAWLIVGMRSPSYNMVGLMVPGLPFVALGRSPDMAWGGTNMRAASSDLYDVSKLSPDAITRKEVRIGVRAWFDSVRATRMSPFGPIVSDSPMIQARPGEMIALRWIGHEPTDEITALLRASRARTPDEFRRAFSGFGVSAQNMLFADSRGNVGQVLAATLPARDSLRHDDPVLDAADPATHWRGFVEAGDLPHTLNPAEGFVASANNRPAVSRTPIGFFFSDDERVGRLQALLRDRPSISVEDLMALQGDTRSEKALAVGKGILGAIGAAGLDGVAPDFVRRLADWDGDYRANSPGPVAFETLLFHLLPAVYGAASHRDLPGVYLQWPHITRFFVADLEALPTARRHAVLAAALSAAARDAARFATWGDMHRLRAAHLLVNAPLIGGAFVVADLPAGGSRETVMKTAHDLVNDRHDARYGSQSRHISDMADPDANWFLLFGGQDGWLGSTAYADQLPLWQRREYIRVPLRPDAVAREFPRVMDLQPKPGAANRSGS